MGQQPISANLSATRSHIAVALATLLAVSIAACGGSDDTGDRDTTIDVGDGSSGGDEVGADTGTERDAEPDETADAGPEAGIVTDVELDIEPDGAEVTEPLDVDVDTDSDDCELRGDCPCVPVCDGRECGDDGCGGDCGECEGNEACSDDGLCVCVPVCDDRECGDDGCGGDCGPCEGEDVCNTRLGTCADVCVPDCSGLDCGDDGCGGDCGGCSGVGQVCIEGACETVPTYEADIRPLLAPICGACHVGSSPPEGLNLSGDASFLVGVDARQCTPVRKRVEPGDSSASYIINKLTGVGLCGSGLQMPRFGTPLTAEQIDLVRRWIDGGALP